MTWLADIVLVVHALLVLFIVGGLAAIWTGAALGWRWVRARTFRLAHLLAIGIVAALAALGIDCPLTVLEDRLRTGAPDAPGFVQRWVGRLLYHDLPAWAFTAAYGLFALLVWLTGRRIPARDK
ncbi:DUF2784 domain-containing protein [Burkholderia pseudomallei]|nr:DUF2784 domain-containing protein [Burkholderia pseudomallei]